MSASIALIILFIATSQAKIQNNTHRISDICSEINLALDFILQNIDSVDLDAFGGIVWTQAHFEYILGQQVAERVKTTVEKLQAKTIAILNATRTIAINSDAKFDRFTNNVLVPNKWVRKLVFGINKLDTDLTFDNVPKNLASFIEYLQANKLTVEISDVCFLEISEKANENEDCAISQNCRFEMIDNTNMDSMYGAPTRLLYMQVAQLQNCLIEKKYYEIQVKTLCNYMYYEANINMELGFIPALDDLLLEQIAFCGYEGYSEFLSKEFVDRVFNMPRNDGCFESAELPSPDSSGVAMIADGGNNTSHGCSTRTTALGTTALAVILRNVLYKRSLKQKT